MSWNGKGSDCANTVGAQTKYGITGVRRLW